MAKFSVYKNGRDPNSKTITPGNVPFNECVNNVQSLPPQLVDSYIKCYEASAAPLPSHLKIEYRKYVREDGNIAIVRVVSRPK